MGTNSVLILGIIILIAGAVMFLTVLPTVLLARRNRSVLSTQTAGTLEGIKATGKKKNSEIHYKVSYTAGKKRIHTETRFAEGFKATAFDFDKKYPAGTPVTVYYDPREIKSCRIVGPETGGSSIHGRFLLIAVIMVAAGILMIVIK